ncbi:hypothetical protein D8B29_14150 [Verminephrobacter eiseniae]|nr:hypothetical protein [Verminephrobacter eiseniae]
MASDATPRCASMASADRQMIGDATLGPGMPAVRWVWCCGGGRISARSPRRFTGRLPGGPLRLFCC